MMNKSHQAIIAALGFAPIIDVRGRLSIADQLRFCADSIGDLTKLLDVPAVRDSAARLALRVMRSRSTIYSRFHSPALADSILGSIILD